MPICAGCERNVSYQELDLHERYCEEATGEGSGSPGSREQLEAKITYMEDQFEERVNDLEREFERRLARIDRQGEPTMESPERE